jgi:acyl-CoA synthetase (NDP forming)
VTKTLAQMLLAPQSVAIIGQSNDATKTAGRPLKYLRQAGYAGRIYPINPRRDEVLGERAWPSLSELPELPDHAYIVASTDATMEAIEECARLGVPVVTALANGFSETGAEGTAREAPSFRRPARGWSDRRASAWSICGKKRFSPPTRRSTSRTCRSDESSRPRIRAA